MGKVDLYPRLEAHYERQIDYYDRQRVQAQHDLSRISLVYSGQLQFNLEPEPSLPVMA